LIVFEYKGEIKRFTPEVMCSMIFGKMKEFAEDYLSKKINNAVIAIPGFFNES